MLELDFRAVKFLFFPRRDLNPHHAKRFEMNTILIKLECIFKKMKFYRRVIRIFIRFQNRRSKIYKTKTRTLLLQPSRPHFRISRLCKIFRYYSSIKSKMEQTASKANKTLSFVRRNLKVGVKGHEPVLFPLSCIL
jgi:hypothetical protein